MHNNRDNARSVSVLARLLERITIREEHITISRRRNGTRLWGKWERGCVKGNCLFIYGPAYSATRITSESHAFPQGTRSVRLFVPITGLLDDSCACGLRTFIHSCNNTHLVHETIEKCILHLIIHWKITAMSTSLTSFTR